MTDKKINNNGFSLIELVVAVLIMGIISGVAITSFNSVTNARVSSAARTTINSLKLARNKAMSLANATDESAGTSTVYAVLYLSNGSYYADVCQGSKVLATDKIGNSRVTLTVYYHGDYDALNDEIPTDKSVVIGEREEGNAVAIFFKKSTGGVAGYHKCSYSGGVYTIGSAIKYGDMPDTINVDGVGDKKNIIIVPATGRSYLDE